MTVVSLSGRHILVGISGGIAAYKIPELIRNLVKAGAEVRVASSRHALEFVTELTLQTVSGHAVYSDVFAAINEHATEHISLPEWADVMLVAPATANVLGKSAAGIADDALTTTIASCMARKPILFAPAMNDKMWANPATQQAIATLRSWENVSVLEPAEGLLACGVSGKGRMPEVEELQEAIAYALAPKDLAGKRVLVTAGGTQEALDPVRFVGNYSTGKMTQAVRNPFGSIHRVDALSAQAMYEACLAAWPTQDIAILSAAVADFTPAEVAQEKIKKQAGQQTLTLTLALTKDIAAALGERKKKEQTLIGFALETNNEEANALRKLNSKHLDAIVLNSLRDPGAGVGTETNRVTILRADGSRCELPLQSKGAIASGIVDMLL